MNSSSLSIKYLTYLVAQQNSTLVYVHSLGLLGSQRTVAAPSVRLCGRHSCVAVVRSVAELLWHEMSTYRDCSIYTQRAYEAQLLREAMLRQKEPASGMQSHFSRFAVSQFALSLWTAELEFLCGTRVWLTMQLYRRLPRSQDIAALYLIYSRRFS